MDGESLAVNSEDLESYLIYSYKQLIRQRINFVPASSPDKYLEKLKAKYKPLNVAKKKKKRKSAKMLPTTKQDEETDSASSPKDGEASIFSPKVTLFNKDELALTWNNVRGVGPGLVNLGNTCFLNSVIQCLTYTPPLANHLLSGEHKKKCHQSVSGSCALCQLQDHVTRVLSTSGGSVRPAPIIQHLKSLTKPFRIGRQEDAHEFLRYYVDSMQKSCLKGYPSKLDPHSKSTTLVHQLFGGYFRSQVKCLKCWNTSDTYDPLLDISVETKNCPTLSKALKKITKPDMLDGDNKYSCPKCKTLTVAQKKFTLHSLPTVLTIQLKRFNYNNYYGTKISKHVSYPEYIDLRPFMSETEGTEEWYHLYAVLVHSGVSCHSGHYYCFVVASNGAWYCMNDTHVTQVRLDTVLSQEAYLLFYIKDTNYRSSTASYTCTMVTDPADNSQEIKTSSNKMTPNKQPVAGLSSNNLANELKNNNSANRLKRIPKLIIRKKPLNKMVHTNDQDTVDDNSDAVSVTKSSNASTLFTPRSVYSHTTIPNVTPDSKKLESVSRKSNSPLSPPHMVKNLSFFIPTSSKDASVQVGDPPEQMKKIAKVMPFPVSPPATKPVARVSPQPQNISPPVQPTPAMNVVEEKAKNKDKIEAKSPEAERHTPLKSPPPISSFITPTVSATSPTNNITNPASTRAATATSSTPPLKTSPVKKSFPSKSCSPQLPISSDTPLVSEQANSTVSASDTGTITTDGETVRIKKKKKKKHHGTAEHSGQEGGGVEHKKKKKKKQKKEHKEQDNGDEPRKKKKKVKHADKEGVWIEKEATPVATSAKKSPLKSPVPPSPTVSTPISFDPPKDTADEQVAKESVKEEPIIDTPLPSKRKPSLPGDTPVPSQNTEETEVEIENKLRPFLLSYYSSSGSDCSSPTIEERELDDSHKTITTPPSTTTTATATTTTDDVFTKEQCTKVTTTVSTTKADAQQDNTSSVTPGRWLGTNPILANVQSKQVAEKKSVAHQQSSGTRDHSTVKQNNVQDNNVSAQQRDSSTNKVEPRSVRQDNSTTNKHDSKPVNNKQHNHQRSNSSTRQDNRSEKLKTTSAKHDHAGDISDTGVNQKSSNVNTSNRSNSSSGENTTGHVSRKSSQRNNSSSCDQQEHRHVKQSSSKDAGRKASNSDCSDDTFSQQDIGSSHRRERHNSSSSSSRHQQHRQQIRRERHSSSSSRQPDGSRERDDSSSDRRWDSNYSSSRWDRQQSNEVVRELTSRQQYELGDKVRSWSGEANTVDSSVAVGSKRRHDDWDREYDAGHVKKVRRHTTDDSYNSTRNPFQEYHSKKHFNKRDNYNRYNRYEQHSGYHWRHHQPYNNSSYRRRSDADNRNYYRR